jgi:pyridinium-3,5-biscarboxylic acid mononucleotide sulfurtransferase
LNRSLEEIAAEAAPDAARGMDRLRARLEGLGRAVVGYSGGIDSAFLLWAATRVLGRDRVLGVTGVSASLSAEQHAVAERVAREIGAAHRLVETRETQDPHYLANDAERCYHCKHELYSTLARLARDEGYDAVLDGSNLDDTQDTRPGFRAIRELAVVSPLLEARLSKAQIRELSRLAGLSAWDRPASPCLSSRVPHGTPITLGLLSRVERGEAFLKTLVTGTVRLRTRGGEARIEVEHSQIPLLTAPPAFEQIERELTRLGYTNVVVDPGGYRQGGADLSAPA